MLELPRVKVCGLTRPEDTDHAVAVGADAVGFVYHPASPRHVHPDAIRALVERLPGGVLSVLVLVDQTPDRVHELVRRTGVSAVQLCGREDPREFADLEARVLRRLAVEDGAAGGASEWERVALGFVLDHPSGAGGTGRAVDLALARGLARRWPCLLAGGLDGGCVAERVRAVAPAGVDAASRLESTPGIKDAGRVRSYVTSALAALEGARTDR